jgi:hypothetical protein
VRRILLLASLFALVTAAPAFAGLANGSFEPVVAAPAAVTGAPASIPGWIASAHGVEWIATSGDDFGAPNGDFVVRLASDAGGAGRIEQAFATTPGERYDVVFWLGGMAGAASTGRATLRVDVAGTARTMTIDNPSPGLLWQAHVLTFTARAAETTLSFRGVPGTHASAAWLDGVAVHPAASGPGSSRDSR